MARNKLTKEDLIKLAKSGANDADLFVAKKISELKDDIEEFDIVIDEMDADIKNVRSALGITTDKLDDKIEYTRSELDTKIETVRDEMAKIDLMGSTQDIIKNLSIIKGVRGEKGDKGDKGDPGKDGKDGIDGKDGKDAEIDLDHIKKEIIEQLPTEEKVKAITAQEIAQTEIDAKKIKGLKELLPKYPPNMAGGSGATFLKSMRDLDLSGLTDGYTITWNASKNKFDMQAGGGAEVNDLTSAVTWANVPDANITESSVTQHQAALSITESQISDLSHVVDVVSNVAQDRILGRVTAGSGDSEELTAAQVRTLINVEDGADVTDATNVDAAGATMNTDTDVSSNSWVLDEDTMTSDSATKVPTQQSVKAYVDTETSPQTPTTYTPTGTTQTITFADNDQLAILDLGSATGDVTLTLSGMAAGGAYTIKVIQGATARNLIFPASVIASSSQTAWATATQTLTMTATDDAVDVVGLTYDGTSTLMTAEFDLS